MKTLNRTIIINLFVIISFSACKKDSDSSSSKDQIIGSWQLEQRFTNGVSDEISDCEKESTVVFMENGNYSAIDKFIEDDICISDPYTGNWMNNGNDIYELRITGNPIVLDISITFPNGKLTINVSQDGFESSVVYVKTVE